MCVLFGPALPRAGAGSRARTESPVTPAELCVGEQGADVYVHLWKRCPALRFASTVEKYVVKENEKACVVGGWCTGGAVLFAPSRPAGRQNVVCLFPLLLIYYAKPGSDGGCGVRSVVGVASSALGTFRIWVLG